MGLSHRWLKTISRRKQRRRLLGDGRKLGDAEFGFKTGPYFRDHVELPFFRHHLKGGKDPGLPEALVFGKPFKLGPGEGGNIQSAGVRGRRSLSR